MSIKVSSGKDNATTMHNLKKLSDKRVQVSSFRQDSDHIDEGNFEDW
jgi:hypothetical protein